MPFPTASSHRAARDTLITVTREYAEDPDRCVRALLSVLAYSPKNDATAGDEPAASETTGADNEPVHPRTV